MYTSIHWLRFVNEIKRRDVRPLPRGGARKEEKKRSLGAIRLGNFRRPLSRMAAVWGARLEEMTRDGRKRRKVEEEEEEEET